MTEQELHEKIINIIKENGVYNGKSMHRDYYVVNDEELADALIAAGIGDVKEAEHRAKTLERAFRDFLAEYLTAVNEANSYDCGIPEMFGRYANVLPYEDKVTNLLNEYLQQAEKELAEERKDNDSKNQWYNLDV